MILTFNTIRGSRKQFLHINHERDKQTNVIKRVFSHVQFKGHCVDIHLSDRS